MLEVQNLSVSYGQHTALENASVRVGRGEIVVILGANGAGKSSLLKAISGICEGKVSGSVRLQGAELTGLRADRIVEAGVALVPEGRGIFPDLSVKDNLALGAHAVRARDAEDTNMGRVLALFPKLGERRRQIVRTMSGGEQQMVAIGRAMMSAPQILTLDEPSLGLSPLLCKELFQSLRTVREAGIGILLVEQNAKQSLAIADRGYLIENGRIVHEAPATALMNDPAVQKAYLGGAAARQAPRTGGAPASRPAPVARPASSPHPQPITTQPITTQPTSATRPTVQKPADIAAAAMQTFERRSKPAPAPAPDPRPVSTPSVQTRPAPPPASSPPSSQRPNGTGTRATSDLLGTDVASLVEQARARSAGQYAAPARIGSAPPPKAAPALTANAGAPQRPLPAATRPANGSGAPSLPKVRMPDLGESQDRLKSALAEIEAAAARARAYRPNSGK